MNTRINRRDFLKAGGATLALAAIGPGASAADEKTSASPARRPIKKAIMWGTIGVKGSILEKMKAAQDAGFEGVEMMSHMNGDEVLKARDETGLTIPSVCGARHWDKPL